MNDDFDRVPLHGNTHPYRGLLGQWGCRWDRAKRIWLARAADAEQIQHYIDTGKFFKDETIDHAK